MCESSSSLYIATEDEKCLLNTMPSKILSKKDKTSSISEAQMRALPAEAQNGNRIALQDSNKMEVSKYLFDMAVPEVPVGEEVYWIQFQRVMDTLARASFNFPWRKTKVNMNKLH